MDLILDFALIAASATAAFYCFVLGRRLDRLQEADKGIGASIASMSESLDQTRQALQAAQDASARAIADLAPRLAEARDLTPRLAEMTDVISELSELAASDIETCAEAALQEIRRAADQCRKTPEAAPARRTRLSDVAAAELARRLKAQGLERLVG